MSGFQLAHPDGVSVPPIFERTLAAAQVFNVGALLLVDGSGNFAECGADPVSIAAVSVSGAGADASGFNRLAKVEFPPGKMQGIKLAGQTFTARYTGALPGADGGSYGVVRDTDGFWKVDFTDTTATRVKLISRRTTSPENINRVVVQFLAANIQQF